MPKEEAEQVVKTLRDAGKTVDAYYYANEGHGFAKRENQIDATWLSPGRAALKTSTAISLATCEEKRNICSLEHISTLEWKIDIIAKSDDDSTHALPRWQRAGLSKDSQFYATASRLYRDSPWGWSRDEEKNGGGNQHRH